MMVNCLDCGIEITGQKHITGCIHCGDRYIICDECCENYEIGNLKPPKIKRTPCCDKDRYYKEVYGYDG